MAGQTSFPVDATKVEGMVNANPSLKTDPAATLALGKVSPVDGHATGMASRGMHILGSLWNAAKSIYDAPGNIINAGIDATPALAKGVWHQASTAANSVTSGLTFGLVGPHGFNRTQNMQQLEQDTSGLRGAVSHPTEMWNQSAHFASAFATSINQNGWEKTVGHFLPAVALAALTDGATTGFSIGEGASAIAADVQTVTRMQQMAQTGTLAGEDLGRYQAALTRVQRFVDKTSRAEEAKASFKGRYENVKDSVKQWADLTHKARIGQTLGHGWNAIGQFGAFGNNLNMNVAYQLMAAQASQDPEMRRIWEQTKDLHVYDEYNRKIGTLGQSVAYSLGMAHEGMWTGALSGAIDLKTHYMMSDPFQLYGDLAKASRSEGGIGGVMGKWWQGLGVETGADVLRTWNESHQSINAYRYFASHSATEIGKRFPEMFTNEVRISLGATKSVEEAVQVMADAADAYHLIKNIQPTMGMITYMKTLLRDGLTLGDAIGEDPSYAYDFADFVYNKMGVDIAPQTNAEAVLDAKGRQAVVYRRHLAGLWDSLPRHTELTAEGKPMIESRSFVAGDKRAIPGIQATLRFSGRFNERIIRMIGEGLELTDNPTDYMTVLTQGVRTLYEQAIAKAVPDARDQIIAETLERGLDFEIRKLFGFSMGGSPEKVYINGVDGSKVSILRHPLGSEKGSGAFGIGTSHLARFAYPDFREVNNLLDQITTTIIQNRSIFDGHVTKLAELQEKSLEQLLRYKQTAAEKNEILAKEFEENKAKYGKKMRAQQPQAYQTTGKVSLDGITEGVSAKLTQRLREIREGRKVEYNIETEEGTTSREIIRLSGSGPNAEAGYKIAHDELKNMIDTVKLNPNLTDVQKYFEVARRLSWERKTLYTEINRVLDEKGGVAWRQQGLDSALSSAQGAYAAVHDFETAIYSPLQEPGVPTSQMRAWALKEAKVGTQTLAERRALEKAVFGNFQKADGYIAKKLAQPGKDMLSMGNNSVDLANKIMAKTFVAMCLSTGGYIMRITGAEVALNAFRIGPRKFANTRLISSLEEKFKLYEKPSVAPNDPKEFISEHGKNPETFMHGSPWQIDNFHGGQNGGVYFTTQRDVAERFAQKFWAGKTYEEFEAALGREKLDAISGTKIAGEVSRPVEGVVHTAKIYGKKLDFNPNFNFKPKRLDAAKLGEWWNGLPDFAKEFLTIEANNNDPEVIARWIEGGYGFSHLPHNWHDSEKFKDFLDKAAGFGYGKIVLKDHSTSGYESILAHPDYIDNGVGTPREIAARDGMSEVGLAASETKRIVNNIVQTVEGIDPSRLFKDPSEAKLKDALGDFASRMHDRFQGAFLGIEKGFFEAMSDDEMWVMMNNISLGLLRHGGAAPDMGHGTVTEQFNPEAHSATVEKVLGIREKIGGGGWEPTEPIPTKRGEDYVDVHHKPEYLATAHVENLSRHHFDTMMHPVMVDLQKELEKYGNYAFKTQDLKYELINRLRDLAYQRLLHMNPKDLEPFKNSKWLINSADPYFGTTGNAMLDHAKRLAMDAVGSVEGVDGLNNIVLHKSLVDQAVSGDIDTDVEMAHRLANMGIEAPRHVIAKEFQDYGKILGPMKSLISPDFFQELNRMGIDKIFRPMIQYASRTPVWAYGFHVAMEEQRFLIEKGLRTEDEAALIADYRATWNMSQFVHNPADKLRFEQNVRLYSPFYFAQNQAYRRAARLLAQDPNAFVRYMKLSLGVTHWAASHNVPGVSGMFSVPGSQKIFNYLSQAIADVYGIVHGPVDTSLYSNQNIGVNADTTSVKTVWPTGGVEGIGMLEEMVRPAAGPYIDIPLKIIGSFLNGAVKESYNKFLEAVLGPIGAKTGVSSSVVPSSFLRGVGVMASEFFNMVFAGGQDNPAMTSAHIDAYHAMWNTKRTQLVKDFLTHQAVQYSFPATYPNQTTDQAVMQACNTWVDDQMVKWMSSPEGKNEQAVSQGVAIGNYATKMAINFNAPASVALSKFFSKAPEFQKIMQQKIDGQPIGLTEAVRQFGEKFPHAMADLVSRFQHPKGSLPTDADFLKWWKADSELVQQNAEFLSYYIPKGSSFEPEAFQIQHVNGLLVDDTMQQYVDALRARLGQDWWYNKKEPEIYARTGSIYYGPDNPNNQLSPSGSTQLRQAAKVYGATMNTPWYENSSYGVKGKAIEVRAIQQMNNIATNPELQQRILKTKQMTATDISKLSFLNQEYKRMETEINTQVAEGRSGGAGRSDMWNTMQAYAADPAFSKFKYLITNVLSGAPTAGG